MKLLTLFLCVASAAYAQSEPRPVTLKEAFALAEARNPDLAAARAQADQKIAQTSRAYAAILPSLVLSVAYDYSSALQQFDTALLTPIMTSTLRTALQGVGPAYGIPGPNATVVDQIVQTYSTELNKNVKPITIVANNSLYGTLVAQQVLFTPQLFLLPAAREGAQAAEFGKLEAREQVYLAVARVFLNLEGIEMLSKAAAEAEEVAVTRERDAQSLREAGMSTQVAVLRAQGEAAQARATLATLSGQQQALLAILESMVGESVRPTPGAQTRIELTQTKEDDNPWGKTYLIRSQEFALQSQRRFNTFDRLAWLPSIVAQAKGTYNSNKAFAGTNWIFDGIISLQWTLYDQGLRSAQRLENDAKTVEYRAQLTGARARAQANWLGARANLRAAQRALEQLELQVKLADQAQKNIASAYRAGFSTSLELATADSQRFFAASAAVNARAQLEIRKAELAAAEGRLGEVVRGGK